MTDAPDPARHLPRNVAAIRYESEGGFEITFRSGESVRGRTKGWRRAGRTAIASMTVQVGACTLILVTTSGDDLVLRLPDPGDHDPVGGRPTIYLDQNHLSTLTKAVYAPSRVAPDERSAAIELVRLVQGGQVVLPMSAGHALETAKQLNESERYQRALMLGRLSAGWQLLDPLLVRQLELGSALSGRYLQSPPTEISVVTLERNALHAARVPDGLADANLGGLPHAKSLDAARSLASLFDALLSGPVPMSPVPGWALQFEEFAQFLDADPRGPEMKQLRTWAKFIADLGLELPQAAFASGVRPEQMSHWLVAHAGEDVDEMPSLGIYRWLLHEKLCDPKLKWAQNDLIDMNYLSVAAGYCDFVVGERRHSAYINAAMRRLGRRTTVYRSIRSVMAAL